MKKWKQVSSFCFLLFLFWSWASPLARSAFPDRPIELVIGNQPGGAMDFIAGAFKDKVAAILGQPVISIYKPGAGTSLAAAHVAHAKPDGHTLLFGSPANLVLMPLTKKGLGYTLDDFAPVCNLSSVPNLMCVRDDAPFKNLADFIQAAKAKRMKYATYGVNSGPHILMEALGKTAGFQPIHIPYPGAAPANLACLGGHVDMAISGGTVGLVGSGKLRVLAHTGIERFEPQPQVPTLIELGYPLSYVGNFYIWVPRLTPPERIRKIADAYRKTAEENRDALKKYFITIEQSLNFLGPEALGKMVKQEYALYKKLIEDLGMGPK